MVVVVEPETGKGVISFKNIAFTTTIVVFIRGVEYLFAGALLVGRWQIEPTGGVLQLGRRMGSL